MIVPVIWLARDHPESGNRRRGWWDQTFMADVLDGNVWRLPHGLEFVHQEASTVAITLVGAVVVIPGRFHADPEGVKWVNEQIAKLPWCVVVITSDEESLMPVWEIEHPAMRLWVMTPRPGKPYPPGTRYIGEGYSPRFRELMADYNGMPPVKGYDVAFAGQVTHQRREELRQALILCSVDQIARVALEVSPGFTQGLDAESYADFMASTRIAPCPAGPATPDSFRFVEALEAGCMPVVDGHTPEGWYGFWTMVYGDEFLNVVPILNDWAVLPDRMPSLLADYPANANRAGSWWQSYKREMVMAMADDVLALTDAPTEPPTLADLITVVMPTSPIPSHPGTEIIDATIASIRARLPDCDIIIACDGVRDEQAERKADYDEYVRKIVWKSNHVWSNVLPIVADEHRHQAGMTKMAMEKVRTPMVLFVEHDTPLVGDIDFDVCARFIASGQANVIRFHHESEILPSDEHLLLDRWPLAMGEDTTDLAYRTANWSQRPHLASSRFYRWVLADYFGDEARTMIEDCLHGVVDWYWREQGVAGWERFKLWLYAPPTTHEDGGIQRSEHLDGRGSDPMFGSVFEYPDHGPGPQGAPRAMSHRED